MSSYVPPKKNTAFSFYISLTSQANVNTFQANPTLAAGDVKVAIDNGSFNNITTLPVVTPAGSKTVLVSLSADEMNGDNIQILFSDAAGAEWCDRMVSLQTSLRQVDDLIYSSVPDLEAIIADSVPADGTRPSIRQALLMLTRFLMERAVVGTTMTVTKENGSTASMTFTLNDASNPTSITRAS